MAKESEFVKITMVDTVRTIEAKNLKKFELKGWKLVKGSEKEAEKAESKPETKEVKKDLGV